MFVGGGRELPSQQGGLLRTIVGVGEQLKGLVVGGGSGVEGRFEGFERSAQGVLFVEGVRQLPDGVPVVFGLQEGHLDASEERVVPTDVGAAIEIVADPAGGGHQARGQLGPSVGVEALGEPGGFGVHQSEGVLNVADRVQGEGLLGQEGQIVLRVMRHGGNGFLQGLEVLGAEGLALGAVSAGDLREVVIQLRVDAKGGVGGDDDSRELPLHGLLKVLKRAQLPVLVGEGVKDALHAGLIGGDVGLANITVKALGAFEEGSGQELLYELFNRRGVELPLSQSIGDLKSQQLDGVGQGVGLDILSQGVELLQQLFAEGSGDRWDGGRVCCCRRHGANLFAPCVALPGKELPPAGLEGRCTPSYFQTTL